MNRVLGVIPVFPLKCHLNTYMLIIQPNRNTAPTFVLSVTEYPHYLLRFHVKIQTEGKTIWVLGEFFRNIIE